MKKIISVLSAVSLALGVTACGSADDASEDATADTVEMPADQAMANAPQPVEDENASADEAMAATEDDAMDAAADAQAMVNDDVEDAIDDAEANMQ